MRRMFLAFTILCALAFGSIWLSCGRDSTVVSSDRSAPIEGDEGAALFEWAIGPIEGITTAWHEVPREITIPAGTTVRFKCGVSASADVVWNLAPAVRPTRSGSIASYHFGAPGRYEISAVVESDRDGHGTGKKRPAESANVTHSCLVIAVPAAAQPVVIESLQPRVGPLLLTESSSNFETMRVFFNGYISPLRQVGPDAYRTSVGRPVSLDVALTDPRFAALVETRISGQRPVLGTSEIRVNTPGAHTVSVGPPDAPVSFTLETFAVEITSHHKGREIVHVEVPTTFEARTDPPGYEDEITWISSTKYGEAHPVVGHGRKFTVAWKGTWGQDAPSTAFTQWIGVLADNAQFSQDSGVSVTYGVRFEQGVYRAYIESETQPLIDVVFNAVTEVEDLTTLRFFGYNQAQLTALENVGPASLILDSRTVLGASLWQGSFPGFGGTSGQRAILSRISQGLRTLQDMCGAANFLANPAAPRPWVPNGCTGVPNLNCKTCCDDHDACYCLHSLTRKGCDDAFLLWMLAQPPPCHDVAPVYYAGVRALGWLFY